MVFGVLRLAHGEQEVSGSLWGQSQGSDLSQTQRATAVFKEVRHTYRIHVTWLYDFLIAGDTWITIKLSPVNNCWCEMSIFCCCIFLSESDSALDWRWHFETVWPDPAVIYSFAVTQMSKLLSPEEILVSLLHYRDSWLFLHQVLISYYHFVSCILVAGLARY